MIRQNTAIYLIQSSDYQGTSMNKQNETDSVYESVSSKLS